MKWNDLKRVVAGMVCLVVIFGQVVAAQEGKADRIEFFKKAISAPPNVEFFQGAERDVEKGLMGKEERLAAVKESSGEVPDLASKPKERPKIEFKPVTYLLLGLSALIGPAIIFLLFRQGQSKRRK